jgi:hypothetical protein
LFSRSFGAYLDQQDLIESYDVVVRLNKGWPVPESLQKCSGLRTDILYSAMASHCLPEQIITNTKEFKKKVSFLVCPFSRAIPYPNIIRIVREFDIPFVQFDSEQYKNIQEKLRTNPNTGIATIIHLLLYPIKKVHITGLSFLQRGYVTGYRNHSPSFSNHNPELQINYFRNYYWRDSRVTADKVFTNIMEE